MTNQNEVAGYEDAISQAATEHRAFRRMVMSANAGGVISTLSLIGTSLGTSSVGGDTGTFPQLFCIILLIFAAGLIMSGASQFMEATRFEQEAMRLIFRIFETREIPESQKEGLGIQQIDYQPYEGLLSIQTSRRLSKWILVVAAGIFTVGFAISVFVLFSISTSTWV